MADNNNQLPIGTATDVFLPYGNNIKDTALIDLVNRVQMYYGSAELSVASPTSSSAKIPKGTVTIGDVNSVYPYQNYLFTITISGAQLRKYLEFSVGRYYKTFVQGDVSINKNSNVQDYNLDILQGADYLVDLTKSGLFDANGALIPNGQPRITKLVFGGSEVQDSQVFKIAMNNYRFSGGGGFLAAAGIKPQNKDPKALNYVLFDSQKSLGEGGSISNLIIKYFQDTAAGKITLGKTSVEAVFNNNWITIPRFYDLINITDLHGQTDSTSLLAGAVNNERILYSNERTVLLSAGDMVQGESISNILKGKPIIEIMNQMNFDSMQIGNHEFDWGADILNQNINYAKFPFLVANMSIKPGDTNPQTFELLRECKPWVIINKDGLKIGIIGIINPDTVNVVSASIVEHFIFQDPVSTVNTLVPQLKSLGADIVVVLAHIGDQFNTWPKRGTQPLREPLSKDLAELIKGLSGVSAVFGGSSHTINYDLVPDATGALIPAAIGNFDGSGAAVIRLAIDGNNNVVGAVPGYLDVVNRLYNSLTPDPAVQTIIDSAMQEMGSIVNRVIGKSLVDMTRTASKVGNLDSNLGNWAADVIKNAGKADFGLLNAGGLRIDIPKGDINIGQIWTLMPFDNVVNVMEMTGEQLKMVLEYIVSGIKDPGHVSGLRFTYNPNKPARFSLAADGTLVEDTSKSRITWITLSDGTPVDLEKTYKVAAPDFIAMGGDHYPLPANSSNLVSTDVLVRDALMEDVKDRQTLNYLSEGRIQFAEYSKYQFIKPDFNKIMPNVYVIKEFGIIPQTIGNTGYFNARVRVAITNPEGSEVEMLGYDKVSNKFYNATSLGYWGQERGIPITPAYIEKDSFMLKFTLPGEYTLKYALIDLETNKEIVSDSSRFIVLDPAPNLSANLESVMSKDEKKKFSVNITANNYSGATARLKFAISDPTQADDIELKYLDDKDKNHDLKLNKDDGTAWFGPEEGFTLNDSRYVFEVKFKKAGVYKLNVEIVQIALLKREKEVITVTEKK